MAADLATYVLDSFALLAHFQGEPGTRRVRAVLAKGAKAQAKVYLSIIKYGEAICITEREQGLTAAQRLIGALDQLPVEVVEADRRQTFAATHLKAKLPIAHADAFALALAIQREAILLTGDPEFRHAESMARIEWLTAPR